MSFDIWLFANLCLILFFFFLLCCNFRGINLCTILSQTGKTSKRLLFFSFPALGNIAQTLSPHNSSHLEILVKSLSETVPVHRFQHLVRKRKFEEADEFAKRFHLDRQSVIKAKLIVLLQENQPDLRIDEVTSFLAELQVTSCLYFSGWLSLCSSSLFAVYRMTRLCWIFV